MELIYKEAAIDAVCKCSVKEVTPAFMLVDKAEVMTELMMLPSAQPEIIRCKDCRYQDKGRNESESWNLCGYRPWLHVPTEDEHYCGYAERRTDEQNS